MALKSPKQKGSRLEREVASEMRHSGLDKFAQRQPLSGAIEWMKGDVNNSIGLSIECKNQEGMKKFWKFWQQVRDMQNPRLIVSGNHRPILVCLTLKDWIDLELSNKQFNEHLKKCRLDTNTQKK